MGNNLNMHFQCNHESRSNDKVVIDSFSSSANCKNESFAKAKLKSNKLMEDISTGNAVDDFSEKHFPKSQAKLVVEDLKLKCIFSAVDVFINSGKNFKLKQALSLLFLPALNL